MIIDAVHSGSFGKAKTRRDPVFGFDMTAERPGVSANVLVPRHGWAGESDQAAQKPAGLSHDNFQTWESGIGTDIRAACPA
jgi:ATP-dependent phosphoenolpyruvate carboxykinase